MKKIILTLLAAASIFAANAQEAKTMYIMRNGEVVCQQLVSEIDSIIFYAPPTVNDPLTYDEGVIINSIKWATRNVGEHGKFVEKPEDYGGLYQWGRKGDGHEQPTSPNYPTNDDSDESGIVSGAGNFDANGQIVSSHPAYGRFIKQSASPWDWRNPQNATLWNAGTETTPIKTVNDPCPCGWRVPTYEELKSLMSTNGTWTETPANGWVFGSDVTIFLPAAGYRRISNGTFDNRSYGGDYWSSTEYSTTGGYFAYFTSSGTGTNVYNRAYGFSVRCVAE